MIHPVCKRKIVTKNTLFKERNNLSHHLCKNTHLRCLKYKTGSLTILILKFAFSSFCLILDISTFLYSHVLCGKINERDEDLNYIFPLMYFILYISLRKKIAFQVRQLILLLKIDSHLRIGQLNPGSSFPFPFTGCCHLKSTQELLLTLTTA